MENLLKLIFGQQASASSIPGQEEVIETVGNDIDVVGNVSTPNIPPVDLDPRNLRNVDQILERNDQLVEGEEASQRSGLFGTKGTLRDILGVVGDAFLIQSGNRPIYAERRRQERIADAMAGFTQDGAAAAERVAGIDPEAARALFQQYLQNNNNLTDNQRQRMETILKGQRDQRDSFDEGARLFGQAAGALARNPGQQEPIRRILQSIQQRFGLGPEFDVPDEITPEFLQAMRDAGLPTNRQITAQQADRRQDEIERRNRVIEDQNQQRLDRPPATRNPTNASIIDGIRRRINAGLPLSPGDQQLWDRHIQGASRGGSVKASDLIAEVRNNRGSN